MLLEVDSEGTLMVGTLETDMLGTGGALGEEGLSFLHPEVVLTCMVPRLSYLRSAV